MALFRKKKKETKISIIKELINCPDNFKFEGEVENGEIILRIKKKKTQVTENGGIILVDSEGRFSRI